jgi:hypothetical protein
VIRASARVRIAIAAVAVGAAVIAAGALAAPSFVSRPAPTIAPTPTIEPSPSPSPATPSPTIAPSPTPIATPRQTERPRPTTRTAGERILPYYFSARTLFPILPPTPQIDFDEPAGADADSYYRGLNPSGQPIFAVREDFMMNPSTAYHEIGHAYEDLLKRKNASVDWRTLYWSFRGFPGTWQDAAKQAAAMPPGMSQWILLPGESWAEAFSVSIVGGGREKTLDYGRTINPVATKAFFQSLLTAPAP